MNLYCGFGPKLIRAIAVRRCACILLRQPKPILTAAVSKTTLAQHARRSLGRKCQVWMQPCAQKYLPGPRTIRSTLPTDGWSSAHACVAGSANADARNFDRQQPASRIPDVSRSCARLVSRLSATERPLVFRRS